MAIPPAAERFDLARYAITELLLTTAVMPDFWSLVDHGINAINTHVEYTGREHGVYLARHDVPMGTRMPRFLAYWAPRSQLTRSPEEPVVEMRALVQIWPRLNPAHQRVLLALAVHDDYEQAAASLGKTYHCYVCTLSLARKQFLRLWHQHETPRPFWGRDIRKRRRPSARSVTATTIRRRVRRLRAETLEQLARQTRGIPE